MNTQRELLLDLNDMNVSHHSAMGVLPHPFGACSLLSCCIIGLVYMKLFVSHIYATFYKISVVTLGYKLGLSQNEHLALSVP